MSTPLIFLAFSNEKDRYLDMLKEESRRLFSALEQPDRKGYIKVHREESAQIDDLFQVLTRNQDLVSIFHYGGHAGGSKLALEAGTGDMKGLATLLAEQKNLKLVFLNGCSTYDQVKLLFDAGVKAVVATSVPIDDRRAMEFSQQFYEGLAHGRSIGQAFQLAEAYLNSQGNKGDSIQFSSNRSFMAQEVDGGTGLPWGLYIQAEHQQEILDFRLPYYREVGLPQQMRQYISRSFEANLHIVEVLDEMCKYNPDLYHEMVRMEGGVEKNKDSSEYPDIIMSHFPWPIGSQIRLLFQANLQGYTHNRIRQLLSLYIVTSQVLHAALLSDVWEWIRQHEIVLPEHLEQKLPDSSDAYLSYDWLGNMMALYQWIRSQQGQVYLGELDTFSQSWEDPESGLQEAYEELEKLRAQIDHLPTTDLPDLCLDVEYMVALVLGKAAFLSRYRMLTVRSIKIDGPRYQTLAYEMDLGDLRLTSSGALTLYSDDSQRRKSSLTNSQSILLAADENRLDQALNLSPFVMDKNSFLTSSSSGIQPAHVFMLGWTEGDKSHYLTFNLSVFDAVKSPAHQVHTEMTLDDFAEGRNVTREKASSAATPRKSLRARRAAVQEVVESPKAFSVIKQQIDTFLSDLDPNRPNVMEA